LVTRGTATPEKVAKQEECAGDVGEHAGENQQEGSEDELRLTGNRFVVSELAGECGDDDLRDLGGMARTEQKPTDRSRTEKEGKNERSSDECTEAHKQHDFGGGNEQDQDGHGNHLQGSYPVGASGSTLIAAGLRADGEARVTEHIGSPTDERAIGGRGTPAERECLIGLNLIPEVTPRRLQRLLVVGGTARGIWRMSPTQMRETIGQKATERILPQLRRESITQEEDQAESCGVRLATWNEPEYPALLREIAQPPPVLYIRGTLSLNKMALAVAVVGTRRASRYGKLIGRRMGNGLARIGICVVSGLAMGIDEQAHCGALEAGGQTVAVLGGGMERAIREARSGLARQIAESGAVISEFPMAFPPAKWTFPQRNRIIAGLSRGVVVVEAPERSGALITARAALEEGREVFAVPGDVVRRGSRGTNRLIRDGAKLVESAEDVAEEFQSVVVRTGADRAMRTEALARMSDEHRRVYEQIGVDPVHVDAIIAVGNLTPARAAHVLLDLELADLVAEVGGRRYMRVM